MRRDLVAFNCSEMVWVTDSTSDLTGVGNWEQVFQKVVVQDHLIPQYLLNIFQLVAAFIGSSCYLIVIHFLTLGSSFLCPPLFEFQWRGSSQMWRSLCLSLLHDSSQYLYILLRIHMLFFLSLPLNICSAAVVLKFEYIC